MLGGVRFYVLPVRWLMHEPLYLPQGVDVLVTHGAPLNILDDNGHWGCPIICKLCANEIEKAPQKLVRL